MSKSIYEFDKKDIVVRVEPAKPIGESIFGVPNQGDRSYIGDRLEFMGILNGCIYLKRTDPVSLKIFGDKMVELPLDIFSEGWDIWVNPLMLLEDDEVENIMASDKELRKQIDLALADENYELADRLSKKIKNI